MRVFLAIACVLLLAACAGPAARRAAPVAAEPAPQPVQSVDVDPIRPPLPEPRPKPPSRPLGAAATGQSGSKPAQHKNVSGVDVDALAGADRPSLVAILGPADEVRDQPPGEVWIYREGGCSIELYLFPQISVSQYAVLGHKFLPSSLGEEERTTCLTKLASRTRAS